MTTRLEPFEFENTSTSRANDEDYFVVDDVHPLDSSFVVNEPEEG